VWSWDHLLEIGEPMCSRDVNVPLTGEPMYSAESGQ
jgi:hypothetical protein